MITARARRAAEFLISAQGYDRLIDLPADLVPQSSQEAYAIQDAVLGDDLDIAGWKVAPPKNGDLPRCSPTPRARRIRDGGRLTAELRRPEIEVEIGIRLAEALPVRSRPYHSSDVVAAIGGVHAALEVLDSRFLDRKAVSPLSALADGQSHGAMVIGNEGVPWSEDLEFADLTLELAGDGRLLATTTGGSSTRAVLEALVWLANHASARGFGMHAGQCVITGARLGPLPLPDVAELTARVESVGRVTLRAETSQAEAELSGEAEQ